MSARRQPSIPPRIPGYEYVRLLGMGGFADVFEYRQELPRRSVAVKVLLGGSLEQDAREAFFSEANVMAQLSHHPSIVTVYHADIAADGRPYLVMEYCSRPGFGTRYRMERFTVAEALRTGIRVASAVEAAHHLGILHRDIKPANILATDFGWPALTDFGIAATLGTSMAATGMSIPWSAPELLSEHPNGDARGDVYSLGATVYSLLAGRSPFEIPGRSNTPADLLSRIERSPLPAIEREDVPAGLAAVLARAMSKDPERRFLSALAFAHALQAVERSMQLPVTSIDLSQDTLPDIAVHRPDEPAAAGTFAPPAPGVPADDVQPIDQATRLRPVVSIDPLGGAVADADANRRAAEVDDQATRLRPVTTITAQAAPAAPAAHPTTRPGGPGQHSSAGPGGHASPTPLPGTGSQGTQGHGAPQGYAQGYPQPGAAVPASPAGHGQPHPRQDSPQQGYDQQGYGQQGYPQQGYPQQSYAQQSYAQPGGAQLPPGAHPQQAPGQPYPGQPGAQEFAPSAHERHSRHYRQTADPAGEAPSGRSSRRTAVLTVSAVVVLTALGGVAYLTFGPGAGDSEAAPTPTPTSSPTLVGGATVPAPTQLTGTNLGDGTAKFTWKTPDPAEGDSYLWQVVAAGETPRAEKIDTTSVVVALPPEADVVCIEVSLVRSDGRASTTPTQGCSQ